MKSIRAARFLCALVVTLAATAWIGVAAFAGQAEAVQSEKPSQAEMDDVAAELDARMGNVGAEIERALAEIDWDSISADVDRALASVDWGSINAEIDGAVAQAHSALAEIDWQEMHTEMASAMAELEAVQLDGAQIEADIRKAMAEIDWDQVRARAEVEGTLSDAEIEEIQRAVDEAMREGMGGVAETLDNLDEILAEAFEELEQVEGRLDDSID